MPFPWMEHALLQFQQHFFTLEHRCATVLQMLHQHWVYRRGIGAALGDRGLQIFDLRGLDLIGLAKPRRRLLQAPDPCGTQYTTQNHEHTQCRQHGTGGETLPLRFHQPGTEIDLLWHGGQVRNKAPSNGRQYARSCGSAFFKPGNNPSTSMALTVWPVSRASQAASSAERSPA